MICGRAALYASAPPLGHSADNSDRDALGWAKEEL